MKKFEITKEQILELVNESSFTKATLNKMFPQAFESELETGKWYVWKSTRYVLLFITSFDIDKVKGYGIENNTWFDNRNTSKYWGYKTDDFWNLTTDKEVETALIAEAKRRGFKANIKITHDGLLNEKGKSIPEGERNILNSNFEYEENVLRQNGHIIYSNGKWAEIISEPIEVTLEQIAEKFNVNVEQLKIKK